MTSYMALPLIARQLVVANDNNCDEVQGVVVTDCLEMDAIAGVLICHTLQKQ